MCKPNEMIIDDDHATRRQFESWRFVPILDDGNSANDARRVVAANGFVKPLDLFDRLIVFVVHVEGVFMRPKEFTKAVGR